MTDGPVIHVDFETFSEVDLIASGAYVYAAHESTDILCMAWAIDDGPVNLWLPGEPVPFDMIGLGTTVRMIAHNASFERLIWRHVGQRRYGFPPIDDDAWWCTAAQAANMGLPRDLDGAAAALGDVPQKDPTGRRIMLQLSKPRKPTKDDPRTRWTPDMAPEKFQHLYEYCRQDVRAERGIDGRLYALSASEREFYLLNQDMNDRGIRIDRALIQAASVVAVDTLASLDKQVEAATGGAVQKITQVKKLAEWMREAGVPVTSLAKASIAALLEEDDAVRRGAPSIPRAADGEIDHIPESASLFGDNGGPPLDEDDTLGMPPAVRRALLIRQEAAKSSTAKLKRMLVAAGVDDRIRGSILYYGAPRTGRESGRLHQPQNFPRGDEIILSDIEGAVAALATGNADIVRMLYGNPMEVVSSCLRAMMVAADGHELMACDFANIEGRVLAWMAGETWKLDAFRAYDAGTGPDLYKVTAGGILGKPAEAVTKKERQEQGKVPELACLGPDTLVAVRGVGYIPLLSVTTEHEVWDGTAWVRHQGLICRGEKETIRLDGVTLTPDHLVLARGGWVSAATVASCESTRSLALATSLDASPCWGLKAVPSCGSNAPAAPTPTPCSITICGKGYLRPATPAPSSDPAAGSNTFGATPTSAPTTPIDAGCAAAYPPASIVARTPGTLDGRTTAAAESASHPNGSPIAAPSCGASCRCRVGTNPPSNSTESTTIGATSPATCGSSQNGGTSATVEPSPPFNGRSQTYDLLCAGPNNRFTIKTDSGTLLVHNCGYQGWVGAFQTFAKLYGLKITDQEAARIAGAWRNKHPKVVRLWSDLNDATLRAVARPGVKFEAGPITYMTANDYLWCRLPSGRVLAYCRPSIEKNDRGEDAVHYWGVPNPSKPIPPGAGNSRRWAKQSGYGGLWCENCLAGDTQVLTLSDWKPLSSITPFDKVWDGVEWVSHDGLIRRGEQPVVDVHGVRATADHKVWTNDGWIRADTVDAAAAWAASPEPEPSRGALWSPYGDGVRWRGREEVEVAVPLRLRDAPHRGGVGAAEGEDPVLRLPADGADIGAHEHARHGAPSGLLGVAVDAGPLPEPEAQGVPPVWRSRSCRDAGVAFVHGLLDIHGADVRAGPDNRAPGQQRGLLGGQLCLAGSDTAGAEHAREQDDRHPEGADAPDRGERDQRHRQIDTGVSDRRGGSGLPAVRPAVSVEPVFDLLNAGPRHRFTVRCANGRTMIVSNCDQAISRDLLVEAERRLARAGYPLVLKVHDELVAEMPRGHGSVAEMEQIAAELPPWAAGLPVSAAGWAGARYGKG